MATETGEGFSPHLRGVTVTTSTTVAGILAGIASAYLAAGPKDTIGISILAIVILGQLAVFKLVGIDVGDFSTKDHVYVAFMTFVFWFISWGLLLTAGTV